MAEEAALLVAERSELPFGRVHVYCADNSDDGGFDKETIVSWETFDGEAGKFYSTPDGVTEELYTIEDIRPMPEMENKGNVAGICLQRSKLYMI